MSVSKSIPMMVVLLGAIVFAAPQPANAQNSAGGYAQKFVSACMAALVGPGDHATRVKQAGFSGRRMALGNRTWIFAPKKEGGLCHMAFGRVFPDPQFMMQAVTMELAGLGFKDTGKDISVASGSNPFAGTSATKRRVFTNGTASVTYEVGGDGVSVSPIFALQRLSQ